LAISREKNRKAKILAEMNMTQNDEGQGTRKQVWVLIKKPSGSAPDGMPKNGVELGRKENQQKARLDFNAKKNQKKTHG